MSNSIELVNHHKLGSTLLILINFIQHFWQSVIQDSDSYNL
jgi:hypothetical protein